METEGNSVGQRVQALRHRRGWTAQQLADECARAGMPSLNRGTIAKIESGVRKSLRAEELVALAGVFQVPVSELLGEEAASQAAESAGLEGGGALAGAWREPVDYAGLDPDSGPLFFLSYAHGPRDDRHGTDPDVWIRELYDDLCSHVRALADLPRGAKAGFMDRELRQGSEWPRQLSQALASCRVFVPLYSRGYFRSEHCGKEWFAFNMRRLNAVARSARPVETIIPALWIPVQSSQLPEAAMSVAYGSSEFNPLYAEHGFYGLMKVRRWRDVYEEAVYLLARQIVGAAETAPVAPGDPAQYESYDSLPSAFGSYQAVGPGEKAVRITIAALRRDELADRDPSYYGSAARDWNPYREESVRPLADHAADLAQSLSYTPEIGDLFQHEAGLAADGPPAGPQVLLIDPWAVTQPEVQGILRVLDARDNPWVQVVVVWNQRDAQLQANGDRLRSALNDALPRKLREGRATSVLTVRGVPTLEEFSLALPTVILAASRQYLRYAAAFRAPDAAKETQ